MKIKENNPREYKEIKKLDIVTVSQIKKTYYQQYFLKNKIGQLN